MNINQLSDKLISLNKERKKLIKEKRLLQAQIDTISDEIRKISPNGRYLFKWKEKLDKLEIGDEIHFSSTDILLSGRTLNEFTYYLQQTCHVYSKRMDKRFCFCRRRNVHLVYRLK